MYNRQLGKSVALKARPIEIYKYHVISSNSKWAVVSEGSYRALRAFETTKQAIEFAKVKASKKIGEVVIHSKSGLVLNRISFK